MSDWKQEKVKLMNALVGKSESWIDVRKIPEQTILSESTFGGRSSLDNQEMAYAREVFDYNKLIIGGALRPSLVQRFAVIAQGFNDAVSGASKIIVSTSNLISNILNFQKVNEMWNIMKYMTNVTPFPKTQDPLKGRNQKIQLIEQAKKYLEDRYKEFMSTVIKDHLRDAQRGGIPSTMNLVNAFVGFKFNNQSANSIMGKTKWLVNP